MSGMHICDRCGQVTPNYKTYLLGPIGGVYGYSLCDDCMKQDDLKRAWRNEQYWKDEITCPWCGYEDPDSWEFEGECDDEYECPSCGELFILERNVSITYTSMRRLEDMPEGWDGE